MKQISIVVYGAQVQCASCVGAPSSIETYEWLQAALKRKYKEEWLSFQYIDIDMSQQEEKHIIVIQDIMENDLFYPLVTVNDEIVGEGIIQLRQVTNAVDKLL
ncbi:MAG: YuzD family protein [Bacillaceae bacterium]